MDQKGKISVVVPIYNVEEYLPRCLDSIIGQTYTNIEIMLVDDGSPDNAGAICDSYAEKESRIRVFHIPNGGVAKARQLGVENSTGDYIVFVDPDDWLPLDSIEVLYSNMSDDVDMVIGNASLIYKSIKLPEIKKQLLSNSELVKNILNRTNFIYGSPWCKLYRRGLFTSNSFPCVRRSQDWLMNLEISMRIRMAKTIPEGVYNYCFYESSTSHKNFPNSSYWDNYLNIISEILHKNGKYSKFEFYYYNTCLLIIFESIMNSSFVSIKDKWVSDTYSYLKKQKLSLKQKLILCSLRFKLLQVMLFSLVCIGRKLRRI